MQSTVFATAIFYSSFFFAFLVSSLASSSSLLINFIKCTHRERYQWNPAGTLCNNSGLRHSTDALKASELRLRHGINTRVDRYGDT